MTKRTPGHENEWLPLLHALARWGAGGLLCLWGMWFACLSGLGFFVQLESSEVGPRSLSVLSLGIVLGYAQGSWGWAFLSGARHGGSKKQRFGWHGALLGAVATAFAAFIILAPFGLMNYYVRLVYYLAGALPLFVAGLCQLAAGLVVVSRTGRAPAHPSA